MVYVRSRKVADIFLRRSFLESRNDEYTANLHQATLNVQRLVMHGNISPVICDRVTRNLQELQRRYNDLEGRQNACEQPNRPLNKIPTGKAGNNRYDINRDHLEFLLSIGHSISEIANEGLLGGKIHRNTLIKFMKANDIPLVREQYTTKTDAELKTVLQEINIQFPNSGIREVVAILKSRHPPIIVQRDRVGNRFSAAETRFLK